MPHRPHPRSARKRLASPDQMARLHPVLQIPLPLPIPLETWRDLMRKHRHPDANPATRDAAWTHLERLGGGTVATPEQVEQFLHAIARDSQTPPGETGM